MPTRKRPKTPLEKKRDKAWDLQSIFIRRSYADWRDIVQCFTCHWRGHWKEAQAGHYKHKYLDFDPYNIHPQCDTCNRWGYGRPPVYKQRLIATYGPEVLDIIDERVKAERQRIDQLGYAYTEEELDQIIKDLTEKIAKL